jgi:two-component system, chemotaxis family, sensor kinase CheA
LTDRRAALIGKFRASSLDRIRRLSLALIDVEGGRASPRQTEEVSRELHTLKGESTMLNFVGMGEVIHAAEDRLAAAKGIETHRRDAAKAVLEALDVLTRWLQGELEQGLGELAASRDMLRAPAGATLEREVPPVPEPDPTARADPPTDGAKSGPAQHWVQVNTGRIDELADRVSSFDGEFRALYFRLRAHVRDAAADPGRKLQMMLADFDRCQANFEDITTAAWGLRLVPVEPVLAELVRYARHLGQSLGKRLRVSVRGGDAQLERSVLDALGEPLMHLVRNAVDHGIEKPAERGAKGEGKLTISAETVSANVVFTIADDGRGIDPAKVRAAAVARGLLDAEGAEALPQKDLLDLLFLHGFSTRSQVTELSGRGVGLDVVRASVEAIGGTVSVVSDLGVGTRFTLSLSATVSKEKNLVIEWGDGLYAIPSRHVTTVARVGDHSTAESNLGGAAIRVRDQMVPLRSLGGLLRPGARSQEDWVVVVESGDHFWAFTVGRPLGEHSLLRRPIDRVVGSVGLLSASSTFEDGRLVLILSVPGLARQSKSVAGPRVETAALPRLVRVLVVDDSAVVRDLMTEILSHAGFAVRAAAGGEQALEAVAEEMPDAILLDIDMPKMDGFEVLRKVREQSDVPIVMLTLRVSAEDQRRAAELGATAYVVKSQFQEATVVEILRRHTAGVR